MSSVLGLSHLCLGCTQGMDEVEQAFASCGYAVQFSNAELPNPRVKQGLVRTWTDFHDMRLMTCSRLPAVELLHHHSAAISGKSNYIPNICVDEIDFAARDVLDKFGISTSCESESENGNLLVTMACNELNSSIAFWEKAMGFVVISCDDDVAKLQFRAMSPTWCIDLRLEKQEGVVEPTYLDDKGCTCLSFLVRDIRTALNDCREHGAREVGEVFPLEIGGKSIDVAFVRGPQSEIIELLQFG